MLFCLFLSKLRSNSRASDIEVSRQCRTPLWRSSMMLDYNVNTLSYTLVRGKKYLLKKVSSSLGAYELVLQCARETENALTSSPTILYLALSLSCPGAPAHVLQELMIFSSLCEYFDAFDVFGRVHQCTEMRRTQLCQSTIWLGACSTVNMHFYCVFSKKLKLEVVL